MPIHDELTFGIAWEKLFLRYGLLFGMMWKVLGEVDLEAKKLGKGYTKFQRLRDNKTKIQEF